MSNPLVNRVRSNLRAQYYSVNDSWLEECVEYYTSENANASLSTVEAFVISQWLLSNLREINSERGSLPPNFNRQAKILLPGKYIVQVDKMYDLSQSKYSQIQKIRNISEDNVKATAVETPAWEPKGKRMIQMHLTDGIQDFTAIEYRPIKSLKDTLLPGFKLMIIGPVMCRKGVIMLKEENYKEIGGEVDSLLKVNALENVLARALGLDENENPYADDNRENGASQNDNAFPEDEFDINLDEIVQIERLSMESTESPEDLPNGRSALTNQGNSNNYRKSQKETGNNGQRQSPIFEQNKIRTNERNVVSRSQFKPMISMPSNRRLENDGIDRFNDRENGDIPSKNDFGKRVHEPSTSKSSPAAFRDEDENCVDLDDFTDDWDEQTFRNDAVHSKPHDTRTSDNGSKLLPKSSKEAETKFDSMKKMPPCSSRIVSPPEKSPTLSAGKRSADTLSPAGCPSKIIRLETRSQLNNKNRKITDFTEKISPKEEMPPKICDFISDVVKEQAPESVIYKTVRGKVTQIEKLLKKDKNWDLRATITDGTASIEIMFAPQVLEELIGFTVSEFLQKKKIRKTNPEVETFLREGFRNAESRVLRMDALMDLELSTDNEIPKVINTTELTEEQKELIEKRMRMMAVA